MPAPAPRPTPSIRSCHSRQIAFVPIAMVAKTFGIIALRKDFPAKTMGIPRLRQKQSRQDQSWPCRRRLLEFPDLQEFCQAAGIDVTLVGYRGAAPALTDAIGGQIDGVCDAAASVSQPIVEKLVKGLVVARPCGSRRCRIYRPRRKQAWANSRRRAGTACSRQRVRRRKSSRN